MKSKIDLETIVKKAGIFKCIKHKKAANFTIESGIIKVNACCGQFSDHIENFIERQVELAAENNEVS